MCSCRAGVMWCCGADCGGGCGRSREHHPHTPHEAQRQRGPRSQEFSKAVVIGRSRLAMVYYLRSVKNDIKGPPRFLTSAHEGTLSASRRRIHRCRRNLRHARGDGACAKLGLSKIGRRVGIWRRSDGSDGRRPSVRPQEGERPYTSPEAQTAVQRQRH